MEPPPPPRKIPPAQIQADRTTHLAGGRDVGRGADEACNEADEREGEGTHGWKCAGVCWFGFGCTGQAVRVCRMGHKCSEEQVGIGIGLESGRASNEEEDSLKHKTRVWPIFEEEEKRLLEKRVCPLIGRTGRKMQEGKKTDTVKTKNKQTHRKIKAVAIRSSLGHALPGNES